jgi:hypothetical protein
MFQNQRIEPSFKGKPTKARENYNESLHNAASAIYSIFGNQNARLNSILGALNKIQADDKYKYESEIEALKQLTAKLLDMKAKNQEVDIDKLCKFLSEDITKKISI